MLSHEELAVVALLNLSVLIVVQDVALDSRLSAN